MSSFDQFDAKTKSRKEKPKKAIWHGAMCTSWADTKMMIAKFGKSSSFANRTCTRITAYGYQLISPRSFAVRSEILMRCNAMSLFLGKINYKCLYVFVALQSPVFFVFSPILSPSLSETTFSIIWAYHAPDIGECAAHYIVYVWCMLSL